MNDLASIDLLIHSDSTACMVHSARSKHNVALAPSTHCNKIAGLLDQRQKILKSLQGDGNLSVAELEEYGAELAEVLLSGEVRQLYDGAVNGGSLELSICASDAQLKSIPWEYVFWPDLKCAPHQARTVCRLVPATQTKPLETVSLNQGIRVMLIVSAPADQSSVEWIETEASMRSQIFAYTPERGAKKMDFRLCEASEPNAVRQEVQEYDPHIVHFLGHGAKDALVFTKHQAAKSKLVSVNNLHNVLVAKSTRAVILSACDTGNSGSFIDPLIPIAEKLVRAGVPAVVANQMPISLRSVHTFCGALYSELLKSGNIDRAVNSGRIAMGIELDSLNIAALEWGIPVLYRRPDCSNLFSSEV